MNDSLMRTVFRCPVRDIVKIARHFSAGTGVFILAARQAHWTLPYRRPAGAGAPASGRHKHWNSLEINYFDYGETEKTVVLVDSFAGADAGVPAPARTPVKAEFLQCRANYQTVLQSRH